MGQSRNKIGTEFEKVICEKNNWTHKPKSPKIIWNGVGKNNLQKIISVDFNPNEFYLLPKSDLSKYDAITSDGKRVEIKKYKSSKLKNWGLYSEPAFKIATKSDIEKVVSLFGNGSLTLAQEKYNSFVGLMYDKIKDKYLNDFISTNIGIQFEDAFILNENIEYRWFIYKNAWRGFDRLSIQFRVIDFVK